jgi:hypothetical protein
MTRRPHGAKPQAKGAQRPAGWPNPMAGRPYFESVRAGTWWLHSHVDHKSILCPRVDGNREEWPTGHMDGRPSVHHL